MSETQVRAIAEHTWKKFLIFLAERRLCTVCDGHGRIGANRKRVCKPCFGRGYFGDEIPLLPMPKQYIKSEVNNAAETP